MSSNKKTKVLCIFDGFGLAVDSENNCISRAKMPHFRKLLSEYQWSVFNADGDSVGQEAGLVGNSEVGHMNIGGLKLVPQLSYQITKSSENNFDLDKQVSPDQLFDPKYFLKNTFSKPEKNKTIHLIGLFSTGTIHSDLRHWAAAIVSAGQSGAENIVLHIISDGRDSDKKSLVATWDGFMKTYSEKIKPFEDKILVGSIGGRFYSMDRDKNLDRVTKGISSMFYNSVSDVFENISIYDVESKSYSSEVFDENIQPVSITQNLIVPNDTVWFLNFRTDRMKQMISMICDRNTEYGLNLTMISMNDYCVGHEIYLNEKLETTRSKDAVGYFPIFKNQPVQNTLAQTISKEGKTQLHIAETEKFNHVTYFFNGGQDKKWTGEDWVVIPSNKVQSHAEKPEMKAKEVTDYILEHGLGKYDYIIVNYANPDMVGHTGDIGAGVTSMEFLDTQLGRLLEVINGEEYSMILIADHGNMEMVGGYTKDSYELTDTEHNANPVPCIVIDSNYKTLNLDRDYSVEWLTHKEIEEKKNTQQALWTAGKLILEL